MWPVKCYVFDPSRFSPHLKVMTYGSGGKEARESQREEIASIVAQQSGGWAKASFPLHVLLCHYEVSIIHYTQCAGSTHCTIPADCNKRCWLSSKVSYMCDCSRNIHHNTRHITGFHGNVLS